MTSPRTTSIPTPQKSASRPISSQSRTRPVKTKPQTAGPKYSAQKLSAPKSSSQNMPASSRPSSSASSKSTISSRLYRLAQPKRTVQITKPQPAVKQSPKTPQSATQNPAFRRKTPLRYSLLNIASRIRGKNQNGNKNTKKIDKTKIGESTS